jgi:uncharacterized protein YbaR (Trm112 family)
VLLDSLSGTQEYALLHVLTCSTCRAAAEQQLAEDLDLTAEKMASVYADLWQRLTDNIPWMLDQAIQRRQDAGHLLAELLSHSPEDRAGALDDPRFQSLELLELALEESWKAQPRDLETSDSLACLAGPLTGHLRGQLGDTIASLYYTRVTLLRANVFRLAPPPVPTAGQSVLTQAEDLLRSATHFLAWPFKSWDRAAYCRTLGLIRWEQGALDEAAALLHHAARGFADDGFASEEAASHALLGLLALDQHQPATAAAFLQRSLSSLVPAARPWLAVRAGLSLALALVDLGHAERARATYQEFSRHYADVSDAAEHVRLLWLEAKLLLRLDRAAEAESLLAGVRRKLIAEPSFAEAVLCSLDHALVLLTLRRPADLPGLFTELETAFATEVLGIEALRGLVESFVAMTADAQTRPQLAAQAEQTLKRLLRFRGYRVVRLPFA